MIILRLKSNEPATKKESPTFSSETLQTYLLQNFNSMNNHNEYRRIEVFVSAFVEQREFLF